MVAEYREAKKGQGITKGTLYEIAFSLPCHALCLCSCCSSSEHIYYRQVAG